MPIPANPSSANPIRYEEYKIWIKGIAAALSIPIDTTGGLSKYTAASPGAIVGAGISRSPTAGTPYAAIYAPSPIGYTALELLYCAVALESSSAASVVDLQLRTISTAPTGGTAGTPRSIHAQNVTPTTLFMSGAITGGAAVIGVVNQVRYNTGITGAAPTTNPPTPLSWVPLYSEQLVNQGIALPAPRAVAAGFGWVVSLTASIATTAVISVQFIFNEVT